MALPGGSVSGCPHQMQPGEEAALLRVRACSVHTASVVVLTYQSGSPCGFLCSLPHVFVSARSCVSQNRHPGLEPPVAQMHAWTRRVSAIIVSSAKTILVEEAANPLIVHCIHRGVRVGVRLI